MSLATDAPAITQVVQRYINGFLERDTAALREAFHGQARLIAAEDGAVAATAAADWFERLDERRRAGTPAPVAKSAVIASIDCSVTAAVARVELTFAEYRFTDFLALVRGADGWRIVDKIYAFQDLRA
jgi:hypothetical protein